MNTLSLPRPCRLAAALLSLALIAAACGGDDDSADTTAAPAQTTAPSETMPMDTEAPSDTMPMDTTEPTQPTPQDTSTICEPDDLVAAVEGGPAEGTLEGMTDDPVGTAASNNPVLTTLVSAVKAAGLVDTLNSAEALTVFAPTDCAFAALDPATLEAALADPKGLLTTVLGFHVIPERLEPEELKTKTSLTTFTGAELSIEVVGDTISLNDGQAKVLVPGIQTANATVYLIDAVLLPPQ